jgi:serine/threonine protein kinase
LTRLPVSEITTQQELGKGSAATVLAGVFQGARVALKMFNPQTRRGTIAASAGEPVPASPLAELRMEACLMQYALRSPVLSPACPHTSSRLTSLLLSDLRHENVVAMIGVSLFPMCIVMELMSCNLYEYLRESVPLNWRLRVSIASDVSTLLCSSAWTPILIACQIVCGMSFLHSAAPSIVHCDLKSPNVMLAASGERIIAKVS